MTPTESKPIYEGKAKQLYPGPEPDSYLMRFKNSATAFNNKKKAEIDGKGTLNQKIAAYIFQHLEKSGVKTHFLRSLSDTEMLVRKVQIIPVEVIIRNIAAGSLCKRLPVKPKTPLSPPIVEYCYKSDEHDDPIINDDHIRAMGIATPEEMKECRALALKVNDLLREFFKKLGIVLVDFKLEFGRDSNGKILLADEVTPDGCRLWDAETMEILDKDRFRQDLGGLTEAYQVVWNRMQEKSIS